MTDRLIYLDHAASTPLDPAVLDAMIPYLTGPASNASSIHRAGRRALDAIDTARDTVAAILGVTPREIIFTGGGSESDNLAIRGVAQARRAQGKTHLIISAIEHHAVLHAAEALAVDGFELTILPVDRHGLVRPADLAAALRDDTALVSIMYANNEVGTIQPLTDLGAICRARDVPLHTDAVQAPGSLPLDVRELGVDLLTIAAHKFYGPQGVGVLYARRGVPLTPQVNGGAQERRRRAGTENVAGIVGLATALRRADACRAAYTTHCAHVRDALVAGILARIPDAVLNGHPEHRLANNANIAFAGIEGESILLLLDRAGIAASSGSACTSGAIETSHVLRAMGLPEELAIGALRFSVGQATTDQDIAAVLALLPNMVEQLRAVRGR